MRNVHSSWMSYLFLTVLISFWQWPGLKIDPGVIFQRWILSQKELNVMKIDPHRGLLIIKPVQNSTANMLLHAILQVSIVWNSFLNLLDRCTNYKFPWDNYLLASHLSVRVYVSSSFRNLQPHLSQVLNTPQTL